MNLPNKLTLLRIFLVIPFIGFLYFGANIAACSVFIIACITDYLDGYIARKQNLITDFGKLMDPLADKILNISALVMFIELNYIYSWAVIIIVAREFLVTGLRVIAASKNEIIAAGNSGKIKTVVQMLAIIAIMFTKDSFISHIIILVPVIFTIWSGYEYIIQGKKYLKG